ncbi:MAG: hypothetical protein ABSB76_20795 [Streptosporangiaceae bacterium]
MSEVPPNSGGWEANSGGPVHSVLGYSFTPLPSSENWAARHRRSSPLSRQVRSPCSVPRTSARPPVARIGTRSAMSAWNLATICGQPGATQAR